MDIVYQCTCLYEIFICEYEILKTIDFKKTNINSIQFESKHFDGTFTEGPKLKKIKEKLLANGFNLSQLDQENILAKK